MSILARRKDTKAELRLIKAAIASDQFQDPAYAPVLFYLNDYARSLVSLLQELRTALRRQSKIDYSAFVLKQGEALDSAAFTGGQRRRLVYFQVPHEYLRQV